MIPWNYSMFLLTSSRFWNDSTHASFEFIYLGFYFIHLKKCNLFQYVYYFIKKCYYFIRQSFYFIPVRLQMLLYIFHSNSLLHHSMCLLHYSIRLSFRFVVSVVVTVIDIIERKNDTRRRNRLYVPEWSNNAIGMK